MSVTESVMTAPEPLGQTDLDRTIKNKLAEQSTNKSMLRIQGVARQ